MAARISIASQARTKLPQFTLRTMFLAMTCLGVLFAVLGTIGLAASLALLLILALVGLHVAGNVLGTKLRDETSHAQIQNANILGTYSSAQSAVHVDCPHSVSGLYQRTRLGWIIYVATVVGAMAGGLLGISLLINFAGTPIRGVIVGAVSSGVLGAFFGFMFGGFLKIWLSAWWQASSESDKYDGRKAARAVLLPRLRTDVSATLVADFDAG
jgi:hypothetical protein